MKEVIKEIILMIFGLAIMFISRDVYARAITMESEIIEGCTSLILAALTSGLIIYATHRSWIRLPIVISKNCSCDTFLYEAAGLLWVGSAISVLMVFVELFIDNDLITAGNNEVSYAGAALLEVVLLIISSAVVAPIIEEVLFRGILLGTLNKVMGIKGAVVVSSLLFGILHRTSLITILVTAATGVALACIYLFHKNLLNSILVHGMYNLIAVGSTLKPELPLRSSDAVVTGGASNLVMIAFLVLIYIGAGVFIYKRLKKEYRIIKECREVVG